MLKRITCLLVCLALIVGIALAASGSTEAEASFLKQDAKVRNDSQNTDWFIADPLHFLERKLFPADTEEAAPADAEVTEEPAQEEVLDDVEEPAVEELESVVSEAPVQETVAEEPAAPVQEKAPEPESTPVPSPAAAVEEPKAAEEPEPAAQNTETTVSVSADVLNQDTEGNEYDADDLYWLSRIIYAESGNQSMESKIAVGNVIMNRVRDSYYPNSIYGVIFQPGQFSPTSNGMINREPDAESIQAAKLCLDGVSILPTALYFNLAGLDCWASRNRPYITTIGVQAFYG